MIKQKKMANRKMKTEEIRKVQLNLLSSVKDVCLENRITYFLAYGTLIGAIRHKGFIPWDDDIDIAMPREEYNRFLEVYNKDRAKGNYVVAYKYDKNFPYTFAKVCDSKTILIEKSCYSYDLGVNIDIFPIDGLPSQRKTLEKHYRRCILLRNVYNIKTIKFSSQRRWFRNLLLFLLKTCFCITPMKFIIGRFISMCEKYAFTTSPFVADLNFGGIKRSVPKDLFSDVVLCDFESKPYSIPVGYDLWLRSIYGNYMDMPPVKKRITHHNYIAYWKS